MKKYSAQERYNYHNRRVMNAKSLGIKFLSTKWFYSSGFTDSFYSIDNTKAISEDHGRRSAFAYRAGLRAGRKALLKKR